MPIKSTTTKKFTIENEKQQNTQQQNPLSSQRTQPLEGAKDRLSNFEVRIRR